MATKPMPMPEGITKDAIDAMTVDEGEWREYESFFCRKCDEPAFLHPYTNLVCGCKKCKFTTHSVSVFFRQVSQQGQFAKFICRWFHGRYVHYDTRGSHDSDRVRHCARCNPRSTKWCPLSLRLK